MWSALVAPTGRIDAVALFGDTDVGEARLTAYLADAAANAGTLTAGTELDAFVTHWSYYRAYLAKYEAMLSEVANGNLDDQGSYSLLKEQITGWLDLANAEKAIADGLLPVVEDDVVTTATPPTTSTPVTYGW